MAYMASISSLRKSLGLTQGHLARLAGVHPMTVSKWERGVLRPNRPQQAVLRALAGQVDAATEDLAGFLNQSLIDVSEVKGMKLSASNQLRGKIVELTLGPVSARIVLEIAPKVRITSVITSESARRLGLKPGKKAVAIIKATEVIVGVDA